MSQIRKIQLTGGSTYVVSLPPKWVKRNSLSKGSEVEIDEINGDIIITGDRFAQKAEIVRTVNISTGVDHSVLLRVLTSIYIARFDTLVINGRDYISPETRDQIKKFSKIVMGVEIFEESARSMTLQNVLDSESFPVANAIRRMSLNVGTMLEDTIGAISKNDSNLMESVINRDDEVDRFQWYIYRESRARGSETEKNIYFLILSRILERTADHAANICVLWKTVKRPDDMPVGTLVDNLDKSMQMYNAAVEAFYSNNFAVLNSLIEMKADVIARKEEIISKSRGKAGISIISSISEEISRVGLYATDIAELAMDNILSSQFEVNL